VPACLPAPYCACIVLFPICALPGENNLHNPTTRRQDKPPDTRVMPKKRHQNWYSKPQSTAPASLSSTAARRNDSHQGASPGVPQHRPVPLVRSAVEREGGSGMQAKLGGHENPLFFSGFLDGLVGLTHCR
jgi:hypothetical protein